MTSEMVYWKTYWTGLINRVAAQTLMDRAALAQRIWDNSQDANDYHAGARLACNAIILEEMEGLDLGA